MACIVAVKGRAVACGVAEFGRSALASDVPPLRDTCAQQVNVQGCTFKERTLLITSTDQAGGVSNIPFIAKNANTLAMESVFAIQTVIDAGGNEFLQMQYSQVAMLNFNGKSFPHMTVGTLIKAF